jgi:protein-disulfide isomerase
VSNRKKRDERAARAAQMRRERQRTETRRTRLITGAIVAVVVALIVGVGVAVFASQRGDGEAPAEITSEHGFLYSAETIGAEKTEAGAPVDVVFYEDFICPACKAWEEQVGSYVESEVQKGLLSVEYRPISFLDDMSSTDYSSRAANAAACVFESDGTETFHEYHDLLFANQPPENSAGLDDTQLNDLAAQAGADDVQSCIENRDFGDFVAEANDEASQNNVVSTPTILVEGEVLEGAEENSVPTLQDLVEAVIAARAEKSGS